MKNLLSLILFVCSQVAAFSQSVTILTGPNQEPPVAVLDIEADSSGVLFPRTDTLSIKNPVEGLIIYDLPDHLYRFYDGEHWISIMTASQFTYWYLDQDGDDFGNPFAVIYAPSPPPNYVAVSGDCNDTDPNINPGASEVCNGLDDNCNSLSDCVELPCNVYYLDADGDGFGTFDIDSLGCSQPIGYVTNSLDCDDSQTAIHPGAQEICDGVDNDCDNLIDDDDPGLVDGTAYYPDADSDGFGDSMAEAVMACIAPAGMVDNNSDCNDSNANIHPTANEECDGIDNNCNEETDEDCN